MITIGYSTRSHKPEFIEYLRGVAGHPKVQIIEKINNGEKSLSQVYNEIIEESEFDIVVLCHDDIYFDSKKFALKIEKHFSKSDYGIIGVAGTTSIHETGRWWTDSTKMVGIVNHEHEGKKWESKFASGIPNYIHQVCLIDGLFIALNKTKIKHFFNEEVLGFHFYDVTFCTENYLSDVKIGVVYDIRITHKSIGMTNDSWEQNREQYIETFKKHLPINTIPIIDYNFIKSKQSKEKYSLIVQTSDNPENLITFIKNLQDLSVYKNLSISLISTDKNINDIKKFESENIKIYEGYFDSLNKNLSVLKWDDTFLNSKTELLFFATDSVIILNDVFSSMYSVFKNEKNGFGCVFPSVLDKDQTIFSNGIEIVQNKEQKINLIFNNKSSFYNILNGYYITKVGSISDLFATTITNLKLIDWFDINLETSVCNLDFSLKSSLRNRKVFIDTNSITMNSVDLNFEKIENELRMILGQYIKKPEFKTIIKQTI
jgi:hypothetical protein